MNETGRPPERPAANPISAPDDTKESGDLPRVEIVLPIEGRIRATLRGCEGDPALAAYVIAQLELDDDAADMLNAARRIRDREAA